MYDAITVFRYRNSNFLTNTIVSRLCDVLFADVVVDPLIKFLYKTNGEGKWEGIWLKLCVSRYHFNKLYWVEMESVWKVDRQSNCNVKVDEGMKELFFNSRETGWSAFEKGSPSSALVIPTAALDRRRRLTHITIPARPRALASSPTKLDPRKISFVHKTRYMGRTSTE